LEANDADLWEPYYRVNYKFDSDVSSDITDFFNIDQESGEMSLNKALEDQEKFEVSSKINFNVGVY
jgi:hypothetical protein